MVQRCTSRVGSPVPFPPFPPSLPSKNAASAETVEHRRNESRMAGKRASRGPSPSNFAVWMGRPKRRYPSQYPSGCYIAVVA